MKVFWNLAIAHEGDVFAALRDLLPDVDWSYTEKRQRRPTALG